MEVPSTTTGVLAEIRVAAGEVAPVGAVVGVIADRSGAAASRRLRLRPINSADVSAPPIAAQAAIPRSEPIERSRSRGRAAAAAKLDPFFEVRTPPRNFGPAQLSRRHLVTPLARRLAGEMASTISSARLRPARPYRRP